MMRSKKWLVDTHGEPIALAMIQNKVELQAKRAPTDPVYVMDHPDVPDSEDSFINQVDFSKFVINTSTGYIFN